MKSKTMNNKKSLLRSFRKEFEKAYLKSLGDLDSIEVQEVLDRYMDMDTEEFDSDDLNEIVDQVIETQTLL